LNIDKQPAVFGIDASDTVLIAALLRCAIFCASFAPYRGCENQQPLAVRAKHNGSGAIANDRKTVLGSILGAIAIDSRRGIWPALPFLKTSTCFRYGGISRQKLE
jgi:hypothetical protein